MGGGGESIIRMGKLVNGNEGIHHRERIESGQEIVGEGVR